MIELLRIMVERDADRNNREEARRVEEEQRRKAEEEARLNEMREMFKQMNEVDLSKGFHQVEVAEEDRDKTCFVPLGSSDLSGCLLG